MAAGEMPGEPANAVTGRTRLVMQLLHGQALKDLFKVVCYAQEDIHNTVLPRHCDSWCAEHPASSESAYCFSAAPLMSNARFQPLPEAGARHKRTLEAECITPSRVCAWGRTCS